MGLNDRCMVLRYPMYGNRPAVIAGCSLKPRSSAQVVLSAFTTAVPLNPPRVPTVGAPRSVVRCRATSRRGRDTFINDYGSA